MKSAEFTIVEKHSFAVRWFHWINFPLLALMIWTGLLIYWANPAYVKIPSEFAQRWGIAHQLARGMGWHFFLMWLFAINGFAYVSYLMISGEWREIFPQRRTLKDAWDVLLHDLRIRKTAPESRGKFNGAQRLAYSSVIFMGAGALATGLAIYKPVQLGMITQLLGGYEAARLEHFLLMIGFVLFFFVHIAQVLRAGWNQFRAMVTGYEITGKDGDNK